jgi:hypothetical protein
MMDLPRYIVTNVDGSTVLLNEDNKPLLFRRQPGDRPEAFVAGMKLPKARAIRDLWPNSISPRHDPGAAWDVRQVLRQWGIE